MSDLMGYAPGFYQYRCQSCGGVTAGDRRSVVCFCCASAKAAARIRELEAQLATAGREALARWMIVNGYATGHGDTIEDLASELAAHVRRKGMLEAAKWHDDWLRQDRLHGGLSALGREIHQESASAIRKAAGGEG